MIYQKKMIPAHEIAEEEDYQKFEELKAKFGHLVNKYYLKQINVYNYTVSPGVPTAELELNPEVMLHRSLFISKRLPEYLTLDEANFYAKD
jgi:hypothetical protein